MKFLLSILSLALLLSLSTIANAEWGGDIGQKKSVYSNEKIEVGIHTGLTKVEANEFVYIGIYKLSELIWKTNSAFMVGGNTSITLAPSWGVKLYASLSTTISRPNSSMDDYDWLVVGAGWSDWSHHPNTELQKGLTLDTGFSVNLYNNSRTIVLDALIGYKRDQWKWKAVGGSFIYTTLPGFRNDIGTFPNVPIIDYEQTINTPYIGMAFDWTRNYLTLGVKFIGSPLVSAKAVDNHYRRTLVITDTFKGGAMIGGNVDLTYHATKNASFNIFYSFQKYLLDSGNAVYFDRSTGITTYLLDDAAMNLNYQTFGISTTYSF